MTYRYRAQPPQDENQQEVIHYENKNPPRWVDLDYYPLHSIE